MTSHDPCAGNVNPEAFGLAGNRRIMICLGQGGLRSLMLYLFTCFYILARCDSSLVAHHCKTTHNDHPPYKLIGSFNKICIEMRKASHQICIIYCNSIENNKTEVEHFVLAASAWFSVTLLCMVLYVRHVCCGAIIIGYFIFVHCYFNHPLSSHLCFNKVLFCIASHLISLVISFFVFCFN